MCCEIASQMHSPHHWLSREGCCEDVTTSQHTTEYHHTYRLGVYITNSPPIKMFSCHQWLYSV